MKQRLITHIQSIQDPALRRTCESILTFDKLFTCPASLSFHHAYEGGLIAHTVEVCDIALQTVRGNTVGGWSMSFNVEVTLDILIAAALWHDVMKTCEYVAHHCKSEEEPPLCRHLVYFDASGMKSYWAKETFWCKIYGDHPHIVNGAFQFLQFAISFGVPADIRAAVTHCILAHHGRKEWGSPVEPQTLEALILHQADMLSAQYGLTKEVAP